MSSTLASVTSAQYTRSAPAAMETYFYDGATLTESFFLDMSSRTGTQTFRVTAVDQNGNQSGDPLQLWVVANRILVHHLRQRTHEWLSDTAGPKLLCAQARVDLGPAQEPSTIPAGDPDPSTMCPGCAHAHYIRKIEQDMARDIHRAISS